MPINGKWNLIPTLANDMLFSCNKVIPTNPHLFFNRTAVSKVSEHKHYVSDLTIGKHLNKK